ncbi:MAG: hypothetical protein ACRD0U_09365 [Acidimicrobiales bacterium]
MPIASQALREWVVGTAITGRDRKRLRWAYQSCGDRVAEGRAEGKPPAVGQ